MEREEAELRLKPASQAVERTFGADQDTKPKVNLEGKSLPLLGYSSGKVFAECKINNS